MPDTTDDDLADGGAGGGTGGGAGGGTGGGAGGGDANGAPDSGGDDAGPADSGAGAVDSGWNPNLGDGGVWAGYDGGAGRFELVCTTSKWCYSFPYPHAQPITAIIPDGPNALWAIAPSGLDVTSTTMIHATAPGELFTRGPANSSVFRATPVDRQGLTGNLWGFGNAGVHRFDGTGWTFVRSLPSYAD